MVDDSNTNSQDDDIAMNNSVVGLRGASNPVRRMSEWLCGGLWGTW